MSGKRFVGLSSKQPVPRLLSVIGNPASNKNMRDVDIEAPPLSSSDLSDSDGLPTKADIQPSRFVKTGLRNSPPGRGNTEGAAGRNAATPALRFKRTRTSTRPVSRGAPSSSAKETVRQSEVARTDQTSSSPASKKPKRNPPDGRELGSQLQSDIFSITQKKAAVRRYGGAKALDASARQHTPPGRGLIRAPKGLTPWEGSPESVKKLRLPSSPSKFEEDPVSPVRKFKAVPDSEPDSPTKASPVRKRRLKMPKDDIKISAGPDGLGESQRPVFRIPNELPELFVGDDGQKLDFTVSSTADTSSASNVLRRSTSPLIDPDSLDPTPLCPLCNEEVDKAHLAEFKERHPRMTVTSMQKFCQQHKRRSARSKWLEKGYPDIDWRRLDSRIAQHHAFVRKILEGDTPSHYGDLFRDSIRSGQNRTLLRSDTNLTPGYYGIRGLRAMSENLIGRFSTLLRKRALQDRLVSARGHTAYLQSVLVPELAVRLIMEDMGVGEEEAKGILTESCWVGELLNDEIADVVLEDDDDGAGNH